MKSVIHQLALALLINLMFSTMAFGQRTAGDYYYLAIAKLKKQEWNAAIADLDRALKLNTEFAEAYNDRGRAKKEIGDVDGALADYDRALKVNPKYAPAYNNRAIIKMEKQNLNGALADYNRAINLDPRRAELFQNRSMVKQNTGDLVGAITDCNRVIELDPKNAVAYNNRGNVRNAQGDLAGALSDYNHAIQLNPKYPFSYSGRGSIHFQNRQWADALADYRHFCKLDPVHQDFPRLYIWLIRARLNEREAANQELAEYFDKRQRESASTWPAKLAAFLRDAVTIDDFFVESGLRGSEKSHPEMSKQGPSNNGVNTDTASPMDSASGVKTAQVGQPLLLPSRPPSLRLDANGSCQVWFYVGMKRLLAGDKTTSIGCFQNCIATDRKTNVEYVFARAELKVLAD
jgi:tetratricopeptide (TPR) repeat protein